MNFTFLNKCILFYSLIVFVLFSNSVFGKNLDKIIHPELYIKHKAFVINATHHDVEVKVIDIYKQELVRHDFIQPKSSGIKNRHSTPWVVPIKIFPSTYRIMVFTQDGRQNKYQSFMVYFTNNKIPLWVITETGNKNLKVLEMFY